MPTTWKFKCTLAFLLSCSENPHLDAHVSKAHAEQPNAQLSEAPSWV